MFGFLFIISIILFVALWSKTNKIEKRMTYLETYLQNTTKLFGQTAQPASVVSESKPVASAEGPLIQQLLEQQMAEAPQTPVLHVSTESPFGAWLKRDWMMKLGALFVILGMAWFLSYAFAEGWIGPVGRIGIGLVIGSGVLLLGRYRMNTYLSQGGILMFIGALGIILTIWAGRELYDFFTPTSALVLMFLTSCVLGATSIHFKRLPLAYANVLLGALAPLLIASPALPITELFTYLLVLSLGAVWVAVVTGWRQVVLMSLGVVFLYSIPSLVKGLSGVGHSRSVFGFTPLDENGLLFSFVFVALFFFVSTLGMRQVGVTKLYDLFTAGLSGLFLLCWILAGASEEWQVLLLTAWTLVFAFGAFATVQFGARIEFFYTYASVGVLLLGTATAVQLDGPALTIAFIFESLIVLIAGYGVSKKISAIPLLALPTILPILLSFESMSTYTWYHSVVNEHSLVLLLMILGGVGVSQYFKSIRLNETEENRTKLNEYANVAGIVASLYGLVYVWIASNVLFGDEYGLIVAVFIYIGVGSALYLSGKKTDTKWKRTIGGILIGLTSAYLLLVAGMILGTFGRIIAYFLIGVVLVAVAWHERSVRTKKGE